MRTRLFATGLAALVLGAGSAHASSVVDPVGDFLPSFVGAKDPDLDVTNFSVVYQVDLARFLLSATFAGPIDASRPGLYVIGVNTGTGVIAPFAGIGEPNVVFNQAIIVQKTGAANLGATALSATISGDMFSVIVPTSALISTGFKPSQYGFNLWPRDGLGSNSQISDFAPQNATLSAPEPSTWAMLVAGFGLLGGVLRRTRRTMSPAGISAGT